jgi:hypothetical protein
LQRPEIAFCGFFPVDSGSGFSAGNVVADLARAASCYWRERILGYHWVARRSRALTSSANNLQGAIDGGKKQ